MTPKEYLTQGYRVEERIRSLRRELNRIREDVPIANYENIGGFSPSVSSPTEIKASKCEELTELIESEMNSLMQIWYNIHKSIAALPDIDEQLVLRYRYLERTSLGGFPSWEIIADKLHYSRVQTIRIHGKALEHLNYDTK
jgi:DNA-directed RNA polymerase specialized sigma subunit